MSLEDAKKTYESQSGDVDYFRGVAIKTNLNGDHADGSLYDRDCWRGAFAKVVQELRGKLLEDTFRQPGRDPSVDFLREQGAGK